MITWLNDLIAFANQKNLVLGGGGVQEKQNTQSKEKLGEREGDSYAMSETPLELMEDWQQERLSKRLSSWENNLEKNE